MADIGGSGASLAAEQALAEPIRRPGQSGQGSVDGAVTFDPFKSQMTASGGRTIFDSSQIPGEIVDLLAVRASVLEKNPHAVQGLLAGSVK